MTNYNNLNTEEESCLVCSAYDDFKELIRESVSVEDAFHVAFSELAEQLIIDVTKNTYEDAYHEGFQEGVIAGIESVALNALNAAEDLQKQFESKCSCGEQEGCDSCPDDIVDVETRRAAYEDF